MSIEFFSVCLFLLSCSSSTLFRTAFNWMNEDAHVPPGLHLSFAVGTVSKEMEKADKASMMTPYAGAFMAAKCTLL